MKHIYIFLFILMVGQSGFAQDTDQAKASFKENTLSQFDSYFENVEWNENEVLVLYAKESYSSLTPERKNTIMELVLSKLGNTLTIVSYEYKRELWKKSMPFNEVNLLDTWDLNNLELPKSSSRTLERNLHPWFFYFGNNNSFSADFLSIYFSARIGFFLLKNRWDLALSHSMGISGNKDPTVTSDLGLMSKVYFPIKKLNISPYAGLGISYVWTYRSIPVGEYDIEEIYSKTWNTPLYLGISWFTGPGSLDLGCQITDDNSIFTVGYTFSPSSLFKK